MADLITEATEDLQRERLKNLFDQYGVYVISLIVGCLLITGGVSLYKSWEMNVKQQQTAQLLELQESADYPNNILKAEKLDLRPSLNAIATLNAASVFMEKNDTKNALTLFERVSKDAKSPGEFKDLATLMQVRLTMNDETIKGEDLIALLKPIYSSTKNPWAAHARLEAAVISVHKLNDPAKAREHLAAILDMQGLPNSLHQKAQALDHVYGLQQNKNSSPKSKTDKE